jgi:hypothetical protein
MILGPDGRKRWDNVKAEEDAAEVRRARLS